MNPNIVFNIKNLTSDETIKRTNSLDFKVPKNNFPREEKIKRNYSSDRVGIDSTINKHQSNNTMLENFDNVYTSNVKKAYPFIINPDDKNIENYCKKHYKVISFFCFTCHAHFCLKCQSEHTEHSFQSFENLKMNKNDITQAEITVRGKTSLLFKNYMNEKLVKKINEKKNEIVRFKLYIIDKYKNENNNFYNIYNFCYIFKLGALLKSDKNDLLNIFFAHNGFKMMIKKFNYFYEKQKLRWLLKNLVSYKKDNQIEEKMIKERKKNIILKILII